MGRPPKKIGLDTFGGRLRHARGNSTQAEFAKKVGVTRSTLAKYERNEIRPLSDFLTRLSAVLPGPTVQWILSGTPDPSVDADDLHDEVEQTPLTLAVAGPKRSILGMAGYYAKLAEEAERELIASKQFTAYRQRLPNDLSAALGNVPGKYTRFLVEVFSRADAFEESPQASLIHSVSCKVYDDVLVGAGYSVHPGPNYVAGTVELPAPPFKRNHQYGIIRVKGQSMEPIINDGDSLIVDETVKSFRQCEGRIVVANLMEDGFGAKGTGSTVKVLRKTPQGAWELYPLNPEERPLPNVAQSQIVGQVVAILPNG